MKWDKWYNGIDDDLSGTHDLFQAKIGDQAEPIELTVSEEMVGKSCFVTDDYNPWYFKDSPFGGRIAPPALFCPLEGIITWSYFKQLPSAVNSKEEIFFLNPVKVGKKVKITATLVDRYKVRDREAFTFEYLTVDEDGTPILRTRRTRTTPAVLARENLGPNQPDPTEFQPMKVTASRDTEIGYHLEPVVKNITLDKSRLYQGWPLTKNIHTDYSSSYRKGIPYPILMANQIYQNITEMLVKFFGKGYLGGNIAVKVTRKMKADMTYTVHGVVQAKVPEGNKLRIVLDVWCENELGQKTVVGTASGLVD